MIILLSPEMKKAHSCEWAGLTEPYLDYPSATRASESMPGKRYQDEWVKNCDMEISSVCHSITVSQPDCFRVCPLFYSPHIRPNVED